MTTDRTSPLSASAGLREIQRQLAELEASFLSETPAVLPPMLTELSLVAAELNEALDEIDAPPTLAEVLAEPPSPRTPVEHMRDLQLALGALRDSVPRG